MSTGTKILLALATMFVGVLAVYYGLMLRGDDQPRPVAGEAEPPVANDTLAASPAPAGASAETAQPRLLAFPREDPGDAGREVGPPGPAWAGPAGSLRPGDDLPSDLLVNRSRLPARPARAEGTWRPGLAPNLAAPPPVSHVPYIVEPRDTLSSIAEAWFGDPLRWDLIAEANPLVDPHRLEVGQELNLPPRDALRSRSRNLRSSDVTRYTVRSGDTLSSIAAEHYGNPDWWDVIYDANERRIGPDPHELRVGMRLRMPALSD